MRKQSGDLSKIPAKILSQFVSPETADEQAKGQRLIPYGHSDSDSVMNSIAVPIGVRSFIRKNIHSVAELEALLLLSRSGHHAWSPEDVARQLYVSAGTAAKTLEALHCRGLLLDDGHRYAFNAEGSHSTVVADLAVAYREHLIIVTNLVHASERRARLSYRIDDEVA
jgi:hypothetical protein